MKPAVVALIGITSIACGNKEVTPSSPQPLPPHTDVSLEGPRIAARMVPAEVFLRSLLVWFGDVHPTQAAALARGANVFDTWLDYLATLGLPDYRGDFPRAEQSNAMMQATLGRLAEAVCIRTAERDLRGGRPVEERGVYAFESIEHPSTDQFEERFDVLHRTFLGYPLRLAPADRLHRFYALYQQIAARSDSARLDADQVAWAGICTALVLHPEAELY